MPADLLLIKTNEAKGNCFIETKNLDGETNLKHKGANKDIMFDFNDDKMVNKYFYLGLFMLIRKKINIFFY